MTNEQLVAELDRDRPVIFGNQSHAVVLTQLQYYRTPLGPNVVAGGVFDPWPGIGARPLTPQEMVAGALGGAMMFVATAALTSETATPAPPSAQPGNDTDSGGSGSLDLIVILFLGLTIAGSRRWRRGS